MNNHQQKQLETTKKKKKSYIQGHISHDKMIGEALLEYNQIPCPLDEQLTS